MRTGDPRTAEVDTVRFVVTVRAEAVSRQGHRQRRSDLHDGDPVRCRIAASR
jgi:hypothetical protein